MKTTVLAAIAGAALLLPLQGTAHAAANTPAANSPQVRECVRDIAKRERSAARSTKGAERRAIIAALGKIKMDCMNGKIDQAHAAAAKLRLNPQQATAK